MLSTNLHLVRLIDELTCSNDPDLRARGENYRFEERVDPRRQTRYDGIALTTADYEEWLEAHVAHLKTSVWVDEPETFAAINGMAALSPAASAELGEDQVLVRIEKLDDALGRTKVSSLVELDELVEVFAGRRQNERIAVNEAKGALETVCGALNTHPYVLGPRFAAFAQDLNEEIAQPDWPDRLRDRLGLAHIGVDEPVALMSYSVRHVTRRRVDHPLVVPTVLDAQPCEAFHPSPRDEDYGRTLNLAGDPNCVALASEVLHPRFDYEPRHILKVGTVTRPFDRRRLAELRIQHLFCLRYLSNREDFGKL
ncbi:MAG: hypothetical protein HQL41_08925 [Alphaproteobacteria bacterium]|nr:hypothetical protein [Alphaproteobacteria bacterium]